MSMASDNLILLQDVLSNSTLWTAFATQWFCLTWILGQSCSLISWILWSTLIVFPSDERIHVSLFTFAVNMHFVKKKKTLINLLEKFKSCCYSMDQSRKYLAVKCDLISQITFVFDSCLIGLFTNVVRFGWGEAEFFFSLVEGSISWPR